MSDLATLYERNAAFVAGFDLGDLPIKPNMSTIILSCVDARVDPAAFAGIVPGDALILRNVGARVTSAVSTEIAMLWSLMLLASGSEPSLGLAIIHHTQCGMERFASPEAAAVVTERLGDPDAVVTYAIADPEQSVLDDIERLRDAARVPRALTVSGHMYDIATGQLNEIVPPKALG